MKLIEVNQWQFNQIFIQTQHEQLGLEELCQPCMVGGLCRGSTVALGQPSPQGCGAIQRAGTCLAEAGAGMLGKVLARGLVVVLATA